MTTATYASRLQHAIKRAKANDSNLHYDAITDLLAEFDRVDHQVIEYDDPNVNYIVFSDGSAIEINYALEDIDTETTDDYMSFEIEESDLNFELWNKIEETNWTKLELIRDRGYPCGHWTILRYRYDSGFWIERQDQGYYLHFDNADDLNPQLELGYLAPHFQTAKRLALLVVQHYLTTDAEPIDLYDFQKWLNKYEGIVDEST